MIKPMYVLNSKKLFSTYSLFSKKADIFYPIKCNDNEILLKLLNEYGSGFEIETGFHLSVAMRHEFDPQKILFYSPFELVDDISLAIDYGVRFFVIDSLRALDILDSFGIKYRFLIRTQVDCSIDDTPKKFGVSPQQFYRLIEYSKNGRFIGFSFYLNQEHNNLRNRKKIIEELLSFDLYKIEAINMGGGIPASEISETIEAVNKKCVVIFEPGRFLLDECISLKCNVIGKKIVDGAKVLYLNVGIYNGLLDVILKNKRFEISKAVKGVQCDEFVLSGPTGDCIDVIGTYLLPSSIDIGDEIIFKNCGAYCEVMSTDFYQYNGTDFVVE